MSTDKQQGKRRGGGQGAAGKPGGARARRSARKDLPDATGPGFFDDYPRFGETSTVAANFQRLNFRYRHMIERNRHLLEGKRVLDIASHDGRFTFAALVGGNAAHVTGIEARESLVENAAGTIASYGVSPDRFRLLQGDVFERIDEIEAGTIDTAMILGFLYHTARQYELIAALARRGVKNVIIDSNVLPNETRPIIRLKWEGTEKDSQIWDKTRDQVLSSTPSPGALTMILNELGYETQVLIPEIEIPRSAAQYHTGGRVTIVGTRD